MIDVFARCYAITMPLEGGFISQAQADRIGDGGGATNFGISLRAVVTLDLDHDGKLDFDLDGDGDVDEADIRALSLHPEKRAEFYRSQYWEKVKADEMPWPWCLFAFDAAVNHGPGAATVLIQKAVGVEPDGRMGPITIAAIHGAPNEATTEFIAQRAFLYARLFARDTRRPILGWSRRNAALHAEAMTERM